MKIELLEDIINFALCQAEIKKYDDGSYAMKTGRLTITIWAGYISYYNALTRHLKIKRLPKNAKLLLMELLDILLC